MVRMMSGGGINSNKVVQSKAGKVEPVARKANPEAVAQQGLATAFQKSPLEQGRGYQPGEIPATGVKGTYNSATQGPASGRTVYGSGSQGTYGPVAQGETNRAPDVPATVPGRDILSDYGKEVSDKGRRR